MVPSPPLRIVICLVALLSLSTSAHSATLTVRQDGTGQFTTINAAKAAAVSGDIIEVGPGVYPEEVDFSFAVTLVSTDGAATTILDGENIRRILIFRAGAGSVVDGFTLRRGFQVSSGAALRVQLGARASARNCVFESNHVDFDGGAVICRDLGSQLDIADCTFRSNTADRYAGAVLIVESGIMTIDRCEFMENSAPWNGAIATNTGAVYHLSNSLFVGNLGDAAAIYSTESSPTISNNTFHANTGMNGSVQITFSNANFNRNIVSGNLGGPGLVAYANDTSGHSCNVYWNNSQGAVVGEPLGAGEVTGDPLFCGVLSGDFTISVNSPAAAAHSPCGQVIGAFPTACNTGTPPASLAPTILSIADVPNDQGNQVRIRWERAAYDAASQPYVITGYGIYRYQGQFLAGMKLPGGVRSSAKSPAIDGWDYIATVPARGDNIYQYVAPTLCNKPVGGDPCYSTFFVSAMTPDPLTYFDSEPDSGYSEDNLAPGAPPAFMVSTGASGAELAWEASEDGDVDHYRIYRLKGPAYPLPIPHNLVYSTPDLAWFDPAGLPQTHYVMTAVDVNGNESDPIEPEETAEDEGPIPVEFALRQNSPNPFNPTTRIGFDVPAGGGVVTIEIFDVAGRRVRNLLNEHRPAGTWSVEWDGTSDRGFDVVSGVYFCRLRAPGYEKALRMTLIE